MGENRKYPRIELKLSVFTSDDTVLALAEICDISIGGICVIVDTDFSPGTRLTLMFPKTKIIRENEIEAEVLRCVPLPVSKNQYTVAAIFLSPHPKFVEDINALANAQD